MVQLGDPRMERLRSVLTASVVLLLIGSIIGLTAHEPEAVSASAPVTSAPPAQAPAPEAAVTTVPTTTPAAKPKAAKSQATTTTLPPEIHDGDYRFELAVEPRCVRVGQEVTATARLKPHAKAVLMVLYADRQPHDHWKPGLAGADGVFVYTWKAAPVPGDASVTMQAENPDDEKKGRAVVPFKVVAAGVTC